MVTDPSSAWYSPDTRIIIITAPPVNTHQWRVHQEEKTPPQGLDRDFEVTRSYAEAAKHVAKTENVPVLDLWSLFWHACGEREERLDEYLYDGLHCNEKGYAVSLLRTLCDP
jgi:isoamyl acetate esterase